MVGNTCMTHLLLGIDVAEPGPVALCAKRHAGHHYYRARAFSGGLPGSQGAGAAELAGFVGSDLVAVLLSNLFDDDGRTRLAVDIGTNGEMALMHKGSCSVCSAAAGPAFEGAGISCGMRGSPGAIDSVRIGQDSRDHHHRAPGGR